ncbi:hypothetical protein P5W04_07855 [Mycobacteroides abscessus subsp. abscessus]|nr:hypothetical protein [Mycobacteroides abscessus subsp. abscessus]
MMTHEDRRAQCPSCTVPTAGGGLCSFCESYSAPETAAQKIDTLVNRVDIVRRDGNDILQGLPADAPLMAVVDLVTALGHLKRAAVALDKANAQFEAAAAEVK